MAVAGVAWVDVTAVRPAGAIPRRRRPPTSWPARSGVAPREVLRCDTDLNNPEAGRVEIELGGGA